MKNKRPQRPASIVVALACLAMALFLEARPGPVQERPREEVTVTAVEVPVRVLFKGQPVRDLTADDFEVYENGVLQKITHVEIVSKRIAGPATPQGEAPARPGKTASRIFLVILGVYDYTEALGEAVDYLFSQVFLPGDRVMMVSEAQVVNADPGQSPSQVAEGVKRSLKQLKSLTTARTEKAFRDLRHEADGLIRVLEGLEGSSVDVHQAVSRFIEHYKAAWRDYGARYLKPDPEFYESLISRIRAMPGEAWAICLQQREMFPQMKSMTRLDTDLRAWLDSQITPEQQVRARVVAGRVDELKRELNVPGLVPTDALQEVFLRAGIPFHLILMKSPRLISDEDFELREVGADYEDALKQVSRASGGYLGFNSSPLNALKEAAEVEDYHYVLVYAGKPGKDSERREIKVKVHRDGIEVISLKTYVAPAPPPIAVREVSVEEGLLAFTVSHYRMTGGSDGRHGRADIRITIYDAGGHVVFDQGKILDIAKKETRIRLKPGLGTGNFFLTIRAVDVLANQSHTYSGAVVF